MQYSEVVFTCEGGEEWQKDLLIDELGQLGYDTFEDTENGFNAYIASSNLDLASLENLLLGQDPRFNVYYTVNEIAPRNWNEEWETNFEPLAIGDCYVRATFHEARPEFPYEVVIDPKMAFGTGHHQTTALMIQYMQETGLEGKNVLDMGCGTAILAILASKMGAVGVTAIDYDPVCVASAIENKQLNHIGELQVLHGSKEAIPNEPYDVVLANINRNILLDQLESYANVLAVNGLLFLSGFYTGEDLDLLVDKAKLFGLAYLEHRSLHQWAAAKFVKV